MKKSVENEHYSRINQSILFLTWSKQQTVTSTSRTTEASGLSLSVPCQRVHTNEKYKQDLIGFLIYANPLTNKEGTGVSDRTSSTAT